MSKLRASLGKNAGLVVGLGYGLCLAGLVIALTAFVPIIWLNYQIIPIMLGAFIYLPGSLAIFLLTDPRQRSKNFMAVRLIRLGFLFIIGVAITRLLMTPGG